MIGQDTERVEIGSTKKLGRSVVVQQEPLAQGIDFLTVGIVLAPQKIERCPQRMNAPWLHPIRSHVEIGPRPMEADME